ncbi:homeobox protein cut [Papilio machaon]|uniref:homeobox protein cut n=1 Tax=Papilio machaon TaxID=76193 RepID=UPI001E663201|nr:homeobox protein cut [Papilio machaon]
MKTLIVFLTLWSTCFSKPSTLQEQSLLVEPVETQTEFVGRAHLQDQVTAISDTTHDEHSGTEFQQSFSGSPLQEKSIIESQQPLLIKKGYRIYRSADEEQTLTDPNQKCNKQVKVNICEEDNETKSNQMRFDDTFFKSHENMTKNEMKKTIKMVKEVVEHMQKDLQNLEDTSTDLLTEEQLQSGQKKSQLQDDFVILHTVLDDLVKHIGDSSQLSNSDADKKDTKHTSHEDTEESRMMKWKDTINRIQENSGRNIEDRFAKDNGVAEINHVQSTSHDTIMENEDKTSPPHIQSLEALSRNNEDAEMSITQDINKKGSLQSDSLRLEEASTSQTREEELSSKSTNTDHMILQNNDFENTHETTKTTEQEDDKTLGVNTVAVLQDHMEDKRTITHMVKRKSDEMEHTLNTDHADEHLSTPNLMHHKNDLEFKSRDDNHASDSATKIDDIKGQTQYTDSAKQSGNQMDTDTLQQVKSSSNSDIAFDSHSSIAVPPREAAHEGQSILSKQLHSTMNSETPEVPHQLSESLNTRLAMDQNNQALRTMSSNEIQTQHSSLQSLFNDNSQIAATGKANTNVGKMDESSQQHFNGQDSTKWAQERFMSDTSMSDSLKMNNKMQQEKSGIHSQNSMSKSEHETGHHHHAMHEGEHMHRLHETSQHQHSGRIPIDEHFRPSLSTSHPTSQLRNEEIHSVHNHNSQLSNGRFAHDHYMMPAMRANMGFSDSTSMSMQSQHNLNIPHGHHFSTGPHGQAMFHNKQISETDSMVQASEHVGMRDAMLRSAGEYSHYYNNQGNNKGSGYQEQPSMQPVSSGSGAVGLFPNANVGGCGIPLLLSCSPNVVSGTLAKGQPTHTAPSYRSMDAYRYHKKRETKNSNSKLDVKKVPKKMLKRKIEAANVIN